MKFHLGILILFTCLVALPTGAVMACGSDNADHVAKSHQKSAEKSCCSKEEAQTHSADDSESKHSGPDCPCDHENGGCHCPGCGMICHSGAASAAETFSFSAAYFLNDSVQKLAFYFSEHLPEAVYFPVWQPPKLGA